MTWLGRWGFATLVTGGGVGALVVVWNVDLPPEIPGFALHAAPIYRLEIGGAVFAVAYFAALALVLALNNRAFTEVGTSGVKAQDIRLERAEVFDDQQETLRALARAVALLGTGPQPDEGEGG